MKTPSRSSIGAGSAACVLAVASLLSTDDATAATTRTRYIASTAVCESPLPQYDATLRKRPLGITNQAATLIFISCSVPGDFNGDQTTGLIDLLFTSLGVGGTVNCTLVAGNRWYGSTSVAGTATVTAGGTSYIEWSGIDKMHAWGSYNFSCNLPLDIELNTIIVQENDTGDGL